MKAPFKYIVCVNDNAPSRVALHFACLRAKKRGGTVEVLHVLPPADFQSLHLVADKMLEEQRQAAESMLRRLTDDAYAATGMTSSIDIRVGQVSDEIIAATKDQESATLVIAADHTETARSSLLNTLYSQLGDRLFTPILLVPGTLTVAQLERLS